jgi:hypothetical protein
LLGQVEIDEQGRLAVVRAEGGAQPLLNRAVSDLNGREGLVIKLPPEEGDADTAILKDLVTRDDPRFFSAIEDNLRRWHAMALAPAKP